MSEKKGEQIFKALAGVMGEIQAIGKDNRNEVQKYNFRGIDDVYNTLQPLMAKYKVFTVPKVIDERSEERNSKHGGVLIYRILKVEYTFYTTDGSSVSLTVIGEGMDSGDKASNKAMAAAHKYAFIQLFSIPTEDKSDSEFESPEVKPKSIPKQTKVPMITHEQKKLLWVQAKKYWSGTADEQSKKLHAAIKKRFKVDSVCKLTKKDATVLIDGLIRELKAGNKAGQSAGGGERKEKPATSTAPKEETPQAANSTNGKETDSLPVNKMYTKEDLVNIAGREWKKSPVETVALLNDKIKSKFKKGIIDKLTEKQAHQLTVDILSGEPPF